LKICVQVAHFVLEIARWVQLQASDVPRILSTSRFVLNVVCVSRNVNLMQSLLLNQEIIIIWIQ